MLSYRHAFHAGNHADVLKHFVLAEVLSYYAGKDKPFWYVDSHAGAGCYSLDAGYAQKNAEFTGGIGRLWERDDLPAALANYVDVVRRFNPDGGLQNYPGSPAVALALLRNTDRLRLFELHPTDRKLLEETLQGAGRQVSIQEQDGFAGLRAVLPPPPRRAVVLIDPPYELKTDYRQVLDALKEALVRFSTGTYIVWYPLLSRSESRQLPERLKRAHPDSWLHVALNVRAPSGDGFGMHGSGLFIVNPPWNLPAVLQEVMPWLVKVLGEDDKAGFVLEHHIP